MKKLCDIAKSVKAPDDGVYCDDAQYWYVRPIDEYAQDTGRDWTCIGGPGVDGIEFGVRADSTEIYAYYPIEGEYVKVADDVPSLVLLWRSGRLTL